MKVLQARIVLFVQAAILSTFLAPMQLKAEVTVFAFDRPVTFSYLSWENKVRVAGGELVVQGEDVSPKGGAGTVIFPSVDLSGHADKSPALRVIVGPGNTLTGIRLLLRDANGQLATWAFAVPAGSSAPVTLLPADGESYARATDGFADLTKITQWQIQGNWDGDGAVDVRVQRILAVPADAAVLAKRREVEAKRAEQIATARAERAAARKRYLPGSSDSPIIEDLYAAAPNVLSLQIRQGRISKPMTLTEYKPEPGDERRVSGDKPYLYRGGKEVGLLIGPPGKENGVVTSEGFAGEPLLLEEADDIANYLISSPDDSNYAAPKPPVRVGRKSKADDWQMPILPGIVVLHRVYLETPTPLVSGKRYGVRLANINTDKPVFSFVLDPAADWTESVHVNQVGFHPGDPIKQAFMSLWMGSGGECKFPAGQAFDVVDVKSGKVVFSGEAGAPWPADKLETFQTTRNFNGTGVSVLDFSALNTPGEYRVVLRGIGCSYPFRIAEDVWQRAFFTQMKGFYNNRSGVALGPPYTDFVRPVCWKPGVNDCMPITQSTYSILDGGSTGKDGLAGGDTGVPVPQAWGGYHDAGDWNPRRIDHMSTTTMYQLELLQLFPEFFAGFKLNIPNDNPGPDLLKECLFQLDCFRRLQSADGGVSYGIETDGDPFPGEVSWKQHMPAYVWAPDVFSSYFYAAVAAKAAAVMEAYDAKTAEVYRESALRAMTWAEADRTRRVSAKTWDNIPNKKDEVYRARSLAAVCLYALTKDERWNQIFLADMPLAAGKTHVFYGDLYGRVATFTYATLPETLGDKAIKQAAHNSLVADADGSIQYQTRNAFGIACDDPGKPQLIGFFSNPHGAVSLLRAHRLTGDPKYLAAAVKGCLFSAGANPSNLTYTTGVGTKFARAMNLDAIVTGQPMPVGMTAYGNIDLQKWNGQWITWPITGFVGKHTQPDAFAWPTNEAFWDTRFWPAYSEFCIDQTMGLNAYVWGYLAAAKR